MSVLTYEVADGIHIHQPPSFIVDYYKSRCIYNTSAFVDINVPSILNLCTETSSGIIIPRGLEKDFILLCKNSGIKAQQKSNTQLPSEAFPYQIVPEIDYKQGVFWYQDKATSDLILHNTARMQAVTASGKTLMSCICMAKLGLAPVLFLANQDRLLKQFRSTVVKAFGIPESEIGIIKAKKHVIKPITCGSLQTMGKEGFDLDAVRGIFKVVFYDECHLSTALTYRRVLLGLAPEKLYGLSATPEHYSSSDLNDLMDALLGPIEVTISEDVIPSRLTPITFSRNTGCSFFFNDSEDMPQWRRWKIKARLDNDLISHPERNKMIVEDCTRLVKSAGHKVIVCVNRVAHGAILYKMLTERGIACSFPYKNVPCGEADDDKATVNHKQLNLDVEALENGELSVIIGTYKLFGTGFDCKPLSAVLLAAPFSGKNTTQLEQVIGRILRFTPTKTQAIAIDYADSSHPNSRLTQWASDRADFLDRKYGSHDFF